MNDDYPTSRRSKPSKVHKTGRSLAPALTSTQNGANYHGHAGAKQG